MGNKINNSYFGYSGYTQTFDLTSMVDQIEGVGRNSPQPQFRIKTPFGYRIFVIPNGDDPQIGGVQPTDFSPSAPTLISVNKVNR